ncbi:hypothetical protein BU24DRAFT_43513 [Aaosphaeria arxii CBS 175.79]|uniref:Zn(2)-C6 fungal-type domain-containing protein n=1 Tax=Aaosphaeria arxii CBS 175.79 TaxID=1450172 RepID=A0A6A5YAH5_9PLEO|nr:uncharacterized protein BU24DRAFT_43513 [Aaosphaeria arxii CBS 175.79]KAF2022349.1 hypothetical protein BU24DRAFT_43513 [Aaosphaeria arxii CBS 175.79]
MVNVGGRSKGCSTCRRRRIKCDQARPICERCRRHGLACDGPRDLTIVEWRTLEPVTTAIKPGGPAFRRLQGSIDIHIPRFATPSINEREIFIAYTRRKLLPNGPIDLGLQHMQLSEGSHTPERMSHLASLSMAFIVFGTQHGQPAIAHRGYAMHARALNQLNSTLAHPKNRARDDVLLTVATLAVMEGLAPSGPKNYLKHMVGLERLLELRDPQSLDTVEGRALFRAIRHFLLFAAIRSRRPSILARPEWKAFSNSIAPEDEISELGLWHILADCTVLIAELEKMTPCIFGMAQDTSVLYQNESIRSKALTLLALLREWKIEWDGNPMTRYPELPVPSDLNFETARDCNAYPFQTTYDFHSVRIATTYMFYNTTLLFIHKVLSSVSDQQIEPYSAIASERSAALEILKCIPYYLRQESRSQLHHSPLVHWSLSTAWATLGSSDSAEGKWMMDILRSNSNDIVAKGLWTK